MTDLAPSQTALRLCAALTLAAAVLATFLASIPVSMIEMRPPLYQPEGVAYGLYLGASLAVSMLSLLASTLLPQAALTPEPSRTARITALAATGAVALIALANIGLASLPVGEVDPTRAYWRQVIEHNRGRLPDPSNPDLILAGAELLLPPL